MTFPSAIVGTFSEKSNSTNKRTASLLRLGCPRCALAVPSLQGQWKMTTGWWLDDDSITPISDTIATRWWHYSDPTLTLRPRYLLPTYSLPRQNDDSARCSLPGRDPCFWFYPTGPVGGIVPSALFYSLPHLYDRIVSCFFIVAKNEIRCKLRCYWYGCLY